jgi:pectate lyase
MTLTTIIKAIQPVAIVVGCILPVLLKSSSLHAGNLPAFPGAEGFGSVTVGGRGGKVIAVTNLNDSGPGSLRAAVDAEGPRIVVFRVSGTIELKSPLRIINPHITIAGQTAPGEGIALRDQHLGIAADEVVIRYLRVRLGDESKTNSDAISGRFFRNIILDHLSASWGTDEVLSLYHNSYVTIQYCIISEPVGNGRNHKFGAIWGDNYSTYHHNLFAHNDSRNPRFASGSGNVDFRNNVIYNWGYNSTYGGENLQQNNHKFNFTTVNMVANYYKPGPATRENVRHRIVGPSTRDGAVDLGKWWVADNIVEGSPEVTADNWLGVEVSRADIIENLNYGLDYRLPEPWPAIAIRPYSATEAFENVLARAGASLPKRDTIDARIVEEVRTGTATHGSKGIISSQADVGGWPELKSLPAPLDSDGDGMPDWWEIQYGLDPNDPSDSQGDLNGTGYTNVEEYLNGTDPRVFIDYTKPENNINTLTPYSLFPPLSTRQTADGACHAPHHLLSFTSANNPQPQAFP